MMIRSNPPGALVYVDDYEIGTTPVATNFTYYGTRKIRLVKEGFETLTLMQKFPTPWYEIPPLDFISENLIPGEIRDRRDFCYQMRPQVDVPAEQLRARAEDLRARGQLPLAMAPSGYSSPAVEIPPATDAGTGSVETIAPPAGQPVMPSGQPMTPGQPQGQPTVPSQPIDPYLPNRQPWTPGQPQGGTGAPNGWSPPPAPAFPPGY
jgi:hypothetical protein